MKNILHTLFNIENDFFQLAKNSKRLTHISLSSFVLPILFLIIAALLTQFVFTPLYFGKPNVAAPWVSEVFELFVLFGSLILIIFLWVRFFEDRKISTLGFSNNNAVKKYLSGFGIGILMNSLVVGLMALFGTIQIAEEGNNIIGIDALGVVLIFLFGFIIQGASEEILSRGWIMQVIGTRYKPWLGVVISTVFFAIVHLGNAGVDLASVINLLLVAILLSLFVINEGGLWFACAWHSSWNWMLGNVYGLSVSGQSEKVSIFDLNSSGNELISGGVFGPEGSLVTTFVILIAIIILSAKIIYNHSEKETNGTISINQP